MRKNCTFFDKGLCRLGDKCRNYHDKSKGSLYHSSSHANVGKKENEKKKIVECELFLNGKCKIEKCDNYHNYSKIYFKENCTKFAGMLNTLIEDFSVLLPYEKKLSDQSGLDLMIIMDCTATMGSWVKKIGDEIHNIVNSILENHPDSQVKVSFIGYRDHCDGDKKYEKMNFTSDIPSLQKFIKKIDASGGGDIADDVAGALDLGLKMDWSPSSVKYALLICDSPCHGVKYHKGCSDTYPNGDPHGLLVDNLAVAYGDKGINLLGITINDSTDIMYQKMSEKYKKATSKEIHVENLGNAMWNLRSFVAHSASVVLGIRNNMNIEISILIDDLSKERSALTLEDQERSEVLDSFFERIYREEELPVHRDEGKRLTYELPEGYEFPKTIQIPESWNLISKEFSCICYRWYIPKDYSVNIDWNNPFIRLSHFKSKVRISETPFSYGEKNYAFYMYDTQFEEKLVGKLPIKAIAYNYNVEGLSKDLEKEIYCDYLANDFNNRIVNIVSNTKFLLNFVKPTVYEIKNGGRFKYLIAEKLIEGSYRTTLCTGKNNESLTESSLIAQAFSHFTWQLTLGRIIITDLMEIRGVIIDAKVHSLNQARFEGSNLGYYGMINFFSKHICNKFCNELKLIHPKRANTNSESYFDFFLDKFERPSFSDMIFHICDLCGKPSRANSFHIFYRKAESRQMYCEDCKYEMKSSTANANCQDCKSNFEFSDFRYKMKRLDPPSRCNKCKSSGKKYKLSNQKDE